MTGTDARPLVLVVDDEREVADTYALRLENDFAVETAYGGAEALDRLDEDVDVVLLDRRMPEVTGDEVLAAIRERDLDCQVVMLTAVDPGFDTLDMPFDDYLCKPVPRADLVEAVTQQLAIVGYRQLSEYFQMVAKRAVLEASMETRSGEAGAEYRDLVAKLEARREALADRIPAFEDLEEAFVAVDREPAT